MSESSYTQSEFSIDWGYFEAEGGLDSGEHVTLDPQAGTTHANGKAIWSPQQVAAYLNRTGGGFHGGVQAGPQSDADLSVIKFGFHTSQASLQANGYVYFVGTQGFGFSEYFNFAQFNEAQKAATREVMQSWDDVIAVSLVESDINSADITFGNLASAPTTQAYAYIPRPVLTSNPAINAQILDIGGDVWVSASQASNFQLDEGRYGLQTLAHEVGHALGISHPGAYNAAPGVSITYGPNAEYAQDTRAYTIMSYFEASSLGARHFDFHLSTTAYSGVPLIHDIAAAQRIYGADMTTRTGNDTYGFNSTIVGRDTFDFTKTPAPIGAIWDAGGIDTIDTSGFATTQYIDLREGTLSSIGGVTYDTAPTYEQVLANRAAAGITSTLSLTTYNSNMAALAANPVVGRLTDNFGIAYGVVIENAIGGSGFDTIVGNEVANVLTGNAGDDVLNGNGGNDTLLGGLGTDAVHGGAGDDVMNGGTGGDTMSGGAGNDLFFVDNSGDMVGELSAEGTDTVSSSISYTLGDNVENLILTDSATTGTGNGLDNVITGNAVANTLSGGAGNDRLIGGDGVDSLVGGLGNDIFVAEINATKVASKDGLISLDRVLDFAAGDVLDLSGIDANSLVDGDQAFTFVGHANPSGAGEVGIRTFGNMNAAENALGMDLDGIDGPSTFAGPVTVVFGNVDGGQPDFAMVLMNNATLTNADFIF
jgi:serralysin